MDQNNPALKSDLFGQQIVLTNQSSKEQLKSYFKVILRLSKSGDKFPVDLDDVWTLAYNRKDGAIKALRTENFYEGSDFIASQNGKVVSINELSNGVRSEIKISVSCMEYLIARKKRFIFDVYRIVFHKVANSFTPSYQIENPIERAEAWIEEQKARMALERKNAEAERLIANQQPKVDYYDKVLNSTSTMTTGQVAACFGMSAIALNKKLCAIDMQYKQSGMYFLKHPYSSYHLSDVRTYPYNKADGTIGTKQYLVWNERGKEFLCLLHENNFDVRETRNKISPEFWIRMLRPQCLPSADK